MLVRGLFNGRTGGAHNRAATTDSHASPFETRTKKPVASGPDSRKQDAALPFDCAQGGWGTRSVKSKSGRSEQRPYGRERDAAAKAMTTTTTNAAPCRA